MKTKLSLFLIFCCFGLAYAAPKIDLVYPPAGAKIGPVSNSFVFGSVSPGSKLSINGQNVPVHNTGAFMAYIPFTSGEFIILLTASDSTGTSILERNLYIPQDKRDIPPDSLCILHKSIMPNKEMSLMGGDRLPVSFQGTPKCKASFSVGKEHSWPMIEQNINTEIDPKVLAFSDTVVADTTVIPGIYSGSCPVYGSEGWENRAIYLYLIDRNGNMLVDSTSKLISIWPDTPERFGQIRDSVAVLKTAPDLGYELFMPRNTVLKVTGIHGSYYRIKLSKSKDAWIGKSSVELYPAGKIFPAVKLSTIRTNKTNRGSMVNISLSRSTVYQLIPSSSGTNLKIILFDVQADMDWINYDPNDGFINDIRWRQLENRIVELEINFRGRFWGYKAFYSGNSLSVTISKPPKINRKNPFKGIKIALDAGHSPDPGAIGPLRTMEKDINWSITQLLGHMLIKTGADILYTRQGSEEVGIYQRPSRAAGWNADILISIHNNASPDGVNPLTNSGYSTYYYQPFSRSLAEEIHKQFQASLPLNDHGFYYGNLVLCRATEFPSVLVEPAFMIVPNEEALLIDPTFQEKIAKALFRGIKAYLSKIDNK